MAKKSKRLKELERQLFEQKQLESDDAKKFSIFNWFFIKLPLQLAMLVIALLVIFTLFNQ